MNKILSILALSAFLGISSALANGTNSVDFMSAKSNATLNAESKIAQNLSKHDIEFLFGTHNAENLNMRLLSKQELEDTKGMWLPAMLASAGVAFTIEFADAIITDYYYDVPIDWEHAFYEVLDAGAKGVLGFGLIKGGQYIRVFF